MENVVCNFGTLRLKDNIHIRSGSGSFVILLFQELVGRKVASICLCSDTAAAVHNTSLEEIAKWVMKVETSSAFVRMRKENTYPNFIVLQCYALSNLGKWVEKALLSGLLCLLHQSTEPFFTSSPCLYTNVIHWFITFRLYKIRGWCIIDYRSRI